MFREHATAQPAALPKRPETVSTLLRGNRILLALLVGAFLVLFWPTIVGLAGHWASDPDFSHGFLIPPVSALILFSRRGDLAATPVRRPYWGLALLLASLALFFLGLRSATDFFQRLALLGVLCGASGFIFGSAVILRNGFPFFFLLFAIPPPSVILGPLRVSLKAAATRLSAETLIAIGIPAIPEGNVLRLGPHLLEVADACSGIRSLAAISAAAALLAYVLHTGIPIGAFLIATGLASAVLANVLRIVLVAIVLDRFGVDWSQGAVHEALGIAVFFLSLALVYAAWRFYEWTFPRHPAEVASPCRE